MARSVTLPALSTPAEELMREALMTDELIKAATVQLEKLTHRKGVIIEELLFHNIREAGNFQLIDKQRVSRKVNPEKLKERFPVEFEKICDMDRKRLLAGVGKNIRVSDAEMVLGKLDLDPVCDLQVSITHTIVKKEIDGTEEGS